MINNNKMRCQLCEITKDQGNVCHKCRLAQLLSTKDAYLAEINYIRRQKNM